MSNFYNWLDKKHQSKKLDELNVTNTTATPTSPAPQLILLLILLLLFGAAAYLYTENNKRRFDAFSEKFKSENDSLSQKVTTTMNSLEQLNAFNSSLQNRFDLLSEKVKRQNESLSQQVTTTNNSLEQLNAFNSSLQKSNTALEISNNQLSNYNIQLLEQQSLTAKLDTLKDNQHLLRTQLANIRQLKLQLCTQEKPCTLFLQSGMPVCDSTSEAVYPELAKATNEFIDLVSAFDGIPLTISFIGGHHPALENSCEEHSNITLALQRASDLRDAFNDRLKMRLGENTLRFLANTTTQMASRVNTVHCDADTTVDVCDETRRFAAVEWYRNE